MSKDGKKLLDNGKVIFHNEKTQPVIEGPKFLKKDGYYYILAPAGGVPQGWQTVLRSKNIYGPYEDKIVLHKGNTDINGPHQGGIVELKSGDWWFMHFQDRDAYGRIVHLQPVTWKDGWPCMGMDINHDNVGEPVQEWRKPDVGRSCPILIPKTSDEFEAKELGLQWQWHANPQKTWYSLTELPGHIRLYAVRNLTQRGNLWFVPNLLLQKFPARSFTATTKISFDPDQIEEKSGLVVMGEKWAFVAMTKTEDGFKLGMYTGTYYQGYDKTKKIESVDITQNTCYLKVQVDSLAMCRVYYGFSGDDYQHLGEPFQAVKGRWIGAKVGLFNVNPNIIPSKGYTDFDWFRVE